MRWPLTAIRAHRVDPQQCADRGSQFYSEWWQFGAPGTIRTSDPQIRSLVLYPAELRARFSLFISGLTAGLLSQSNSGRSRKRPLATGSEADWQGPEAGIWQSFCAGKVGGKRG